MTDRTILVHVEIDGTAWLAGRLEAGAEGGHENARFEADPQWLKHPLRPFVDPALELEPGPYKSGGVMPLFGALGDSAPDRWGRTLMRRSERRGAGKERREPRVLRELDLLLGVNEAVRAGNLRFAEEPREFLGRPLRARLPGVKDLKRIADAVRCYQCDDDTPAQRDLLLDAGALLGGSRPKVSIVDEDGHLAIAKVPSIEDERGIERWEALTLELAAGCGIAVPRWRLERIEGGGHALVSRRFDREPQTGRRIGFVTMMGLLAAYDNKSESYLEMAKAIRRLSSRPRDDLAELWRRAVFTVLISDKDNHLRNHGLVLGATGWRLAPAYDMNPTPQKVKPRELAISLDGIDDRSSLRPLFDKCEEFAVGAGEAAAITRAIAQKVSKWRSRAKAMRFPEDEIRDMRPAFDHEDMEAALRGRPA